MFRLFTSLLIGMSLLFSPLAMANGEAVAAPHGPAMAVAVTVADGHCDDTDAPSSGRTSDTTISCALVCAAVPASEPVVGDRAAPPGPDLANSDHQSLAGIHPEGMTPPPRMTPEI